MHRTVKPHPHHLRHAARTMQTLVSLTDTSNPAKWSMLRFSFRCLRPFTWTSFHHQPEAQHPTSSAIHKLAADYPIYRGQTGLVVLTLSLAAFDPKRSSRVR